MQYYNNCQIKIYTSKHFETLLQTFTVVSDQFTIFEVCRFTFGYKRTA